MTLIIAIDGPSGSGKSTVARTVATELKLAYLDTGAMYRAATWWCLQQHLDLADQEAVSSLVASMPLSIAVDPRQPGIVVAEHDVTQEIRTTRISTHVSQVATNLKARDELVRQQQDIVATERAGGFSQGRGIVLEGRDTTTVVTPAADLRILLTASPAARLARRTHELHGHTSAEALTATQDQVLRRDQDDATVSQFLTTPDGVTPIDSSDLSLTETVAAVLALLP